MGNITLAMKALKVAGYWTLLTEDESDITPHPLALRPIAKLTLE